MDSPDVAFVQQPDPADLKWMHEGESHTVSADPVFALRVLRIEEQRVHAEIFFQRDPASLPVTARDWLNLDRPCAVLRSSAQTERNVAYRLLHGAGEPLLVVTLRAVRQSATAQARQAAFQFTYDSAYGTQVPRQ